MWMEIVDGVGTNASGDALGSNSNSPPSKGPRKPYRVAQVSNHSQVASQKTRVVNVHDADMGDVLIIYIYTIDCLHLHY
jgi:hypothetical protein